MEGEKENVVYLETAELPVERVLSAATEADLKSITIVGRKQNGEMYYASSHSKIESIVLDLERMRVIMVDGSLGR